MAVVSTNHTFEALRSRPTDDLIAIWHELEPPTLEEMDGEFVGGLIPPVAIKHAEIRKEVGPGEWVAKAFSPTPHGSYPGQGYNVWISQGRMIRNTRFATDIRRSVIDDKLSFCLFYDMFRHHNAGNGMMNEVRKVEDGLYIGTISATIDTELFGPVDRATGRSRLEAFVIRGPFVPCQGVDEPAAEV